MARISHGRRRDVPEDRCAARLTARAMQGPSKRGECDCGACLGIGSFLRAGIPRKAWGKRRANGVIRRDGVPGDPKPHGSASWTQGIAGCGPPSEEVHHGSLLVVIEMECSATDGGRHVAPHTYPHPVEV